MNSRRWFSGALLVFYLSLGVWYAWWCLTSNVQTPERWALRMMVFALASWNAGLALSSLKRRQSGEG